MHWTSWILWRYNLKSFHCASVNNIGCIRVGYVIVSLRISNYAVVSRILIVYKKSRRVVEYPYQRISLIRTTIKSKISKPVKMMLTISIDFFYLLLITQTIPTAFNIGSELNILDNRYTMSNITYTKRFLKIPKSRNLVL